MKHLILITMLAAALTNLAFAMGEIDTDCFEMAESTLRVNTKENIPSNPLDLPVSPAVIKK